MRRVIKTDNTCIRLGKAAIGIGKKHLGTIPLAKLPGYVVDSLWSAPIAFEQSSDYESPTLRMDALRGRALVSPLLAGLTEHLANPIIPNSE